MIEELRSGTYGMTLKLPAKLKVLQDGARCAVLVDEASQTHWTLLWAPELHMDLRKEHRADLRTHMDWYARDMFEANGLCARPTATAARSERRIRGGRRSLKCPTWTSMV